LKSTHPTRGPTRHKSTGVQRLVERVGPERGGDDAMTRTRVTTRRAQTGVRNDKRVVLDYARATAPTFGIGALSASRNQEGIDMSGCPAQTVGRRFNYQHERGRPTNFTRAGAPSDGGGAVLAVRGDGDCCGKTSDHPNYATRLGKLSFAGQR